MYLRSTGSSNLDISKNVLLKSLNLDEMSSLFEINHFLDISHLINLEYLGIGTTDGYENFSVSNNKKLKILGLSAFGLNTLDVSQNTELEELYLSQNGITSIDISKNVKLKKFDSTVFNDFEELDFSNNPLLTYLNIESGALKYLNLKNDNNKNLSTIYYQSFAKVNPLKCVIVDDPTWSKANWSNKFPQGTQFSLDCIPEPVVNIPDANFKSTLLANTVINTNADNEIQVSEALKVTSLGISFAYSVVEMSDSYRCIKNIEGLQYFENLTELRAVASEMYPCSTSTPVDLSGLKHLTYFECAEGGCGYVNLENNLSIKHVDVQHASNSFKGCYNLETFRARFSNLELDFTNYTKLYSIYSEESLSSLIVKGCNSLEMVELDGNFETLMLDFSDCTNLKTLILRDIKLTELNLTNVNKLEKLVVNASNLDNLDLSNMPNLKTAYIAFGINNLNIKNGSLFTVEPNFENSYKEGLDLEYASDLKSICVDEGEYEFVKSLLKKYGYNPIITTDCNNLSVSENELNTLNTTFSPNPTQGKITFTERVDELKVFDLSGRLVKNIAVNTTEVDLSDLQNGVYMMQVSQGQKTFNTKVVKE